MYEVLAMLKPDAKFTVDQMAAIVEDVCSSAERQVDRDGDAFSILAGDSQFHISFSDAPHIIEESHEIAEHFGIPCSGCSRRYEMAGHDPDMLFRALRSTGR